MAGAYTALADDVNAIHYNPAGLSVLSRREVGATHAEWLLDSKFDAVAYAHPTRLGSFGFGLTRLSTGRQEARDAGGRLVGEIGASDSAYSLAYGRAMGAGLPGGRTSLGGSVKFLESRIGGDSASTVAVDLGVVHSLRAAPLSLGAAVLNLGRGMRFLSQTDALPLTLSVGASYRLAGGLTLAVDARHEPNARRNEVGIGTEYAVLARLAMRAGYSTDAVASADGAPLSGLGGGFGLRFGLYRADYTLTPFGALGNAHRLSLGAKF